VSNGKSSVFLIVAVFALMFVLLYFGSQPTSVVQTRPELSESEIRTSLMSHIRESDGVEEVVFAVDHPRAGDKHFPLIFYHSNGTLFRINSTDFSVVGSCYPSIDESCPIEDPGILNEIRGRLVYFVEAQVSNGESLWHRYFIDSSTGKILISS
jgi:hypothetical protein